MATPVDFDRRAIADARAARRFYARVSAALAGRFMADLDDAVARVSAHPQAWSPHVHGTRVCRFRTFPYSLVYVEEPARVVVVAVAHDRRRPGYWQRRLP